MRRIGVLTSGGDSPGMNPALRAVTREAIENNLEVLGFKRGFAGVIENDFVYLDLKRVGGIIQRGGTMLLTARCDEFKTTQGRRKALANLERNQVEALIVVGGDGSFRGAYDLYQMGMPVIGIPATIDNDIYGTDMALGVDTALNNIVDVVDKIKDTASSHERTFIIEVMGRGSGYLALAAAIATGAEGVVIPEVEHDLEAISLRIKQGYERGKTNNIVIVAEGKASGFEIAEQLKRIAGIESKVTVLGHLQRGGSPSFFDRLLGARLGAAAVEKLLEGERGKMVGLVKKEIQTTDFATIFEKKRGIHADFLYLAETLSR